jgi:hypothetical protein
VPAGSYEMGCCGRARGAAASGCAGSSSGWSQQVSHLDCGRSSHLAVPRPSPKNVKRCAGPACSPSRPRGPLPQDAKYALCSALHRRQGHTRSERAPSNPWAAWLRGLRQLCARSDARSADSSNIGQAVRFADRTLVKVLARPGLAAQVRATPPATPPPPRGPGGRAARCARPSAVPYAPPLRCGLVRPSLSLTRRLRRP